MRTESLISRLAFALIIATPVVILVSSCALLEIYRDTLPTLATTLLTELDATLALYENEALRGPTEPAEAAVLRAIQKARRALILSILDCLASEYPSIPITDQLERLNTATALAPPDE